MPKQLRPGCDGSNPIRGSRYRNRKCDCKCKTGSGSERRMGTVAANATINARRATGARSRWAPGAIVGVGG